MSRLTPSQLVYIARQHFESGRTNAAQDLCRKVLSEGPARADALHLLGIIANQAGRHDAAAEFLAQAVALEPDNPALHAELGRIGRQSGRLDEAAASFRQALRLSPGSFDLLCDLACTLADKGELAASADAYRQALQARPAVAGVWMRLGDVLLDAARPAEAVAAFEQALASQPGDPAVQLKLASALQLAGRPEEALAACRAAAEADPRAPEPLDRLGLALHQAGRLEEAAAAFKQAATRDPQYVPALVHLGDCLLDMGCADPALDAYRAALAQKPADESLLAHLKAALPDEALLDDSIAECRAAVARSPADARAHFNVGVAHYRRRNADAAIAAYRQAIELDPSHAAATNNLGLALKDAGRLDEAIGCLRRAVELRPELPECRGNLLYLLHFDPGCDAAALHREHLAWGQAHADPLKASWQPHENDRSPERRLRIGYVSPNFKQHSVGRFLTRLFDNHDREAFEIVGYSGVRRPDALTARIRQRCDRWVDTTRLSDQALAEQVRNDRIDILVDLTMHLAESRLLAFARKPAPVQVTYLAYCSMTGLDAIDYRLTDPYLDPKQGDGGGLDGLFLPPSALCGRAGEEARSADVPCENPLANPGLMKMPPNSAVFSSGSGEGFVAPHGTLSPSPGTPGEGRGGGLPTVEREDPHPNPPNPPPEYREREQEKAANLENLTRGGPVPECTLHLPQSYWCYDPGIETPEVNPLPTMSRGHVTFASLNNFCKASPAALSLWARILRAVPSAHLLMHAWPGGHREHTRELFRAEGVADERLRFFDMLSLPQYFRLHHAIDIALDAFPYAGGTTTCDALWMGVPTISLVGEAPITRSGLSILSNVGLPEFAVDSQERYLETAIALASDLPRLAHLRSTMRDRMRASPLMDGGRFARDVEAAYRLIWRRWCGRWFAGSDAELI